MKSEIVNVPNNTNLNATDFNILDVEQLRGIIAECLRNMADNYLRLALAVKAAEAKGDDLSDLRIDLLPKLRLIACGQLLPDVLAKGWPARVVQFVARLPITEQQRLVDGESLPVVVYNPASGEPDEQRFGIIEINKDGDLWKQVFAPDHIRTISEQKLILAANRTRAKAAKLEKVEDWRIDHEKKGAWHKRKFHSLAVLEAVVKTLRK